jgi:hypothetical protein
MGGEGVRSPAEIAFAPVLVLEVLLAAYAAVGFGLVMGRPIRRLVYMLPAAFVGVLFGQVIAAQMRSPGLMVGDLHLLEAAFGAALMLLVVRRLGV